MQPSSPALRILLVGLALARLAVEPARAEWIALDNFDGHSAGALSGQAGPWAVTGSPGAFTVEADPARPGNQVLVAVGPAGLLTHQAFAPIPKDSRSVTLFYRLQFSGMEGDSTAVHLSVGRSTDNETPLRMFDWRMSLFGRWPSFAVRRSSRHAIHDLITEFTPDLWISVWAEIRTATTHHDIYVAEGNAPKADRAHLLSKDTPLRNNQPKDLFTIRSEGRPKAAKVRIDDVYLDRTGLNLTSPSKGAPSAPATGKP